MHVTNPVRPGSAWLKSLNADGGHGLALACLCLFLALVEWAVGPARTRWYFERDAIGHGELWRLLSAHLVHLNALHTALNLAGLILLWCLFARAYAPRAWALILLLTLIALDLGLWFSRPPVQWYAGASGLLHGGLGAGTLAAWRRPDAFAVVLTLTVIVKLGAEQLHGASLLAGSLPVLVDAHVYGVLGGVLGGALARRLERL